MAPQTRVKERAEEQSSAMSADQQTLIRMVANDLHRLNQSVMKAVDAGVSVELVRSARHHGGDGPDSHIAVRGPGGLLADHILNPGLPGPPISRRGSRLSGARDKVHGARAPAADRPRRAGLAGFAPARPQAVPTGSRLRRTLRPLRGRCQVVSRPIARGYLLAKLRDRDC